MHVPDMVVKGLPNAKPLVAGRAIVLAVENAVHVFHVDLDMTPSLYKLVAHQTLIAIGALVNFIPQKELHAGGVIICKEGEQICQLLYSLQ